MHRGAGKSHALPGLSIHFVNRYKEEARCHPSSMKNILQGIKKIPQRERGGKEKKKGEDKETRTHGHKPNQENRTESGNEEERGGTRENGDDRHSPARHPNFPSIFCYIACFPFPFFFVLFFRFFFFSFFFRLHLFSILSG